MRPSMQCDLVGMQSVNLMKTTQSMAPWRLDFALGRQERLRHCWSIVSVLPTCQWEDAQCFASFRSNDSAANDVDGIRLWLFGQCIERYQQLLKQIKRNDDIFASAESESVRIHPLPSKPNLNILDVDETLVDQRYFHRAHTHYDASHSWEALHYRCAIHWNARDLCFGFRKVQRSDDSESVVVAIFRRFLMHYIATYQRSANIVVYALCEAASLIPITILIEMYFNFAYRFRHFRKAPFFAFDYVIGAQRDARNHSLTRKSLSTLARLVGDLGRLEKIFIVDDSAERVWNIGIPPALRNSSCAIFALQCPPFSVRVSVRNLDIAAIGRARQARAVDRYLEYLIKFEKVAQQMPIEYINRNGLLGWIKHDDGLCNGRVIGWALDCEWMQGSIVLAMFPERHSSLVTELAFRAI